MATRSCRNLSFPLETKKCLVWEGAEGHRKTAGFAGDQENGKYLIQVDLQSNQSGFPQQVQSTGDFRKGKGCLVRLRLILVLRLRKFWVYYGQKSLGLVWFLLELDWECDRMWSSFNSALTSWLRGLLRDVDSSGLLMWVRRNNLKGRTGR